MVRGKFRTDSLQAPACVQAELAARALAGSACSPFWTRFVFRHWLVAVYFSLTSLTEAPIVLGAPSFPTSNEETRSFLINSVCHHFENRE